MISLGGQALDLKKNVSPFVCKGDMNRMNRRSFVSTAATSVAALATLGTACRETEAQLVYTKSDWKLSEFNQLAKNPAQVKQVYDIIPIADGRFLNNIKNSLNGLYFGPTEGDEQRKCVWFLGEGRNYKVVVQDSLFV